LKNFAWISFGDASIFELQTYSELVSNYF